MDRRCKRDRGLAQLWLPIVCFPIPPDRIERVFKRTRVCSDCCSALEKINPSLATASSSPAKDWTTKAPTQPSAILFGRTIFCF